jgi:hypothetical protein
METWYAQILSAAGEPNGIQGLAEGDDGALLIATRSGIRRLVMGKSRRRVRFRALHLSSDLKRCSAIATAVCGSELCIKAFCMNTREGPICFRNPTASMRG